MYLPKFSASGRRFKCSTLISPEIMARSISLHLTESGKSRSNQYGDQRNQAIKRNLITVYNIIQGTEDDPGESSHHV